MFLQQIAQHITDTQYEQLPQDVVHAAKLRLIDALSCSVGGYQAPSNDAFMNLYRSWGGTGQATVLGYGEKLPLAQAALMNCLTGRSFDFEVCGPSPEGINRGKMVGHVCSTTDPTALSVAEFLNADGKELIVAVVLGGDIGARLAVSEEFNFDKCFEVCGTANAFGALAVVARLMKLDQAAIINAYGILLHMMSGSYQSLWDGADTFKLPGALAAYNAVTAVQLSQAGFGGVKDALTSPLGYYNLFSVNYNPEHLVVDLGKTYYAKGMHKIHPSCYGNHNPIECALDIVREHQFAVEDIEQITMDVPPHRLVHFLNQTMTENDTQARSLFSIPYAVANVMVNRSVEIAHYTHKHAYKPDVMALTEKVKMLPATDLTNHLTRLAVHLKDGRVLRAERNQLPLGWAENPVGEAQVIEKFWRNIDFAGTVDKDRAERALAALMDLENQADVQAIASNLC
ncbi:MmgE/PrpD family protein [Ectopseudomonas mendocina]|uniref:MmgE/PrpD family protein n=1 Tax=Ectopseudomonas mendocina TaxID=300 RepID=A0ABZ2RMV3_ECTME